MAKPDNGENYFKYENDNQNTTPATGSSPQLVLPDFYQKGDFRDVKFKEMYGTQASKRDHRKFKKYLESEQGQQDWLNFEKAESDKYFASIDARQAALKKYADELMKPSAPKAEVPVTPTASPVKPVAPALVARPKPIDWNQKAIDNGFKDMAEVKAWQAANGLQDDGKFGDASAAYWKKNQWGKYKKPVDPPKKQYYYTHNGKKYSYTNNTLTELTNTPTTGWVDGGEIKKLKAFRNVVDFQNPNVTFGGMTFANPYYVNDVFRFTDNAPDWNQSGEGEGAIVKVNGKTGTFPLRVWNDRSFALDYANGRAYELKEDGWGEVDGRGTDEVLGDYSLYTFFDNFKNPTQYKYHKQGGIMNKINYFQQGGAAPQQDMQKQVVALVQAAMQGDQKATQTVNKIMEAAKAGDQQAVQLAQMIQQVAKQMQGQATAAKWGAKLSYIRSLKYANGGKACPTCQAGAPIQPVKKVEEKACGGKAKKAKKRYFGGWL